MLARPDARFLMCRPEHFAVAYSINPWMDPTSWCRDDAALAAASAREWHALHRRLRELGAEIELVPAVTGVPDLVFTANAAVVLDGKVLLARFRHSERRLEEPCFAAAFRALEAQGIVASISTLPDGMVLEGAGDCVFDAGRNLFWLGYGQRSDKAARRAVEDVFGIEALALELVDPRFYHMDTALCPLARGDVMYVPGAFASRTRATIRARVAPEHRIELAPEDGKRFAANAVMLNDVVVLSGCSERLRRALEERGYAVVEVPLGSFMRSGGSAFCLTLRLDRRSAMSEAAIVAGAA
jgi:N-dimethylarginine dimethylaminohydrolase